MRQLRLGLLLAGLALGVAAEWVADDARGRGLAVADLAVGCVLLACGFLAWTRRPESRVGLLMIGGGYAWFLGTLAEPALFLHRGPLVHLHLSYPTGRLPTRFAQTVVAFAYVTAVIEPLARNDALTLALSGLVALAAARVFLGTSDGTQGGRPGARGGAGIRGRTRPRGTRAISRLELRRGSLDVRRRDRVPRPRIARRPAA